MVVVVMVVVVMVVEDVMVEVMHQFMLIIIDLLYKFIAPLLALLQWLWVLLLL